MLVLAPAAGGSGVKPRCLGHAATIVGTEDNDVLVGTAGHDVIVAFGGGDWIQGLGGRDVVCAGEGGDYVLGGPGADELDGGPGTDTASYADVPAGVTVDLAAGTATDSGPETAAGFENLRGSPYDDDLFGDAGPNEFYGEAGDDLLQGLGGGDFLDGGDGNDILRAGPGIDNAFGGPGDDDECALNESITGCERFGFGSGGLHVDSLPVDSIDPALGSFQTASQIQDVLCSRLVTYRDATAPAGSQLVPDAAVALPDVSADGRTYTFRIRAGVAFSPPSNEVVTAATFKASIERAFAPTTPGPASFSVEGIVGLTEFRSGAASEISGIVANGDSLTITLEQPGGKFLAQLALPYFCAVPIGTPVDPFGSSPPIPSSGPYYVTYWVSGVYGEAFRNPNYRGRRPSTFAFIGWTFGNSLEQTRTRVESGIQDTGPILPTAAAELDALYGPGSPAAAAGRQRYFGGTGQAFWYLALNTERVFADQRLRRAVSYALDRRQMVALHGVDAGVPTDQYLPPGMPGYADHDLFPLGGDVATAKALAKSAGVTTTNRTAVRFYTFQSAPGPAIAAYVKEALEPLGIDVEILTFTRTVQREKMGTRGEPFDLGLTGWGADYLDPFNFLDTLLNGARITAPGTFNEAYFDDPALNARLDAAAALTGTARENAYMRLDRDLAKASPLIAYINPRTRSFFSDRIGCQSFKPVTGTALNRLCYRP